MSKIGQKPVVVPNGVTVTITGNVVDVKGPNGVMKVVLPTLLSISQENNLLTVKRQNEAKKSKSLHGLFRQLVYDAVTGVEKMWEKRLEVVGTGYNVKLQGEDLVFKVGYSHPVIYKKVKDISFKVEGANKAVVLGCDKQLVGQVAFQIKMLKKPDVYKGKGIRYEGETLRIKPGKKAKAATGAAA